MHTSNRVKGTVVIAIGMLLILGCNYGQLFAPEPTPTHKPTRTPKPTSTPQPTSTPTSTPTPTSVPTSTPLPTSTPTSTLIPFAIQDPKFEGYKQDCKTDIDITGVDGDNFKITVHTLAMIDGKFALFCWGAKHTWIGTLTYAGYTFASDKIDPLQFMVDENKGYVYIGGKGSVTSPDGTVTNLGNP